MLHGEEYRQTRPPPALQRRCPLRTLRGTPSVVTGGTVDRSVNLLTCHAVPGGRAVAVDAPTHAEIGNLSHPLHGFDRPVTGLANDAGVDVGAVIEVHEIG